MIWPTEEHGFWRGEEVAEDGGGGWPGCDRVSWLSWMFLSKKSFQRSSVSRVLAYSFGRDGLQMGGFHGPDDPCHVTPPPSHPAACAPLAPEYLESSPANNFNTAPESRDKTSQLSPLVHHFPPAANPIDLTSCLSSSSALPLLLRKPSRVARDNRRPYSKRSAQHSPIRQHARRGRARGTSPIRFLAPPALT